MHKILKHIVSHKVLYIISALITVLAVLAVSFYTPKSYCRFIRNKNYESISCVYMDEHDGNIYKGNIDSNRYSELSDILKCGKYSKGLAKTKGKITYYYLEIKYSNGKTITFNDHFISDLKIGKFRKGSLDFDSIVNLVDKDTSVMMYER